MDIDLKSLRKSIGHTGTWVARVMDVSQPQVSLIESGKHRPRPVTLACYYAAVGRSDLIRTVSMLNEREVNRVLGVQRRYEKETAEPLLGLLAADGLARSYVIVPRRTG